jgi:hypothetical protein
MATADFISGKTIVTRFYQMVARPGKSPEGCQARADGQLSGKRIWISHCGYQRLIAEFPSSSWAAALIQQRNLEWFKKSGGFAKQNKQ